MKKSKILLFFIFLILTGCKEVPVHIHITFAINGSGDLRSQDMLLFTGQQNPTSVSGQLCYSGPQTSDQCLPTITLKQHSGTTNRDFSHEFAIKKRSLPTLDPAEIRLYNFQFIAANGCTLPLTGGTTSDNGELSGLQFVSLTSRVNCHNDAQADDRNSRHQKTRNQETKTGRPYIPRGLGER